MNALNYLTFWAAIIVAPAFGCGDTVNGTRVDCGNNWIRWTQRGDSFERYSEMGSRGSVRRGQIRQGCLVFGPYADLPYTGRVSAHARVEALVNKRGMPAIPPNTVMFTMDFAADSGQRVLSRKDVTFGEFRDWSGRGTTFTRCTTSDPCTAGLGPYTPQQFKVYTNSTNLDLMGRDARELYQGLEIRVCNLNTLLTKLHVLETVIELTY